MIPPRLPRPNNALLTLYAIVNPLVDTALPLILLLREARRFGMIGLSSKPWIGA